MSARLPDPLPWRALARPLASAEDALARLDERLARSPIRAGWIATHFSDAAAALWLEGQLVHIEDLVLHDAEARPWLLQARCRPEWGRCRRG